MVVLSGGQLLTGNDAAVKKFLAESSTKGFREHMKVTGR